MVIKLPFTMFQIPFTMFLLYLGGRMAYNDRQWMILLARGRDGGAGCGVEAEAARLFAGAAREK